MPHGDIKQGKLIPRSSQLLDIPSGDCYLTCEHEGLLEMCVDLGEAIQQGDILARIYDPSHTGTTPIKYRTKISGILAQRHFPGLIGCGDCLAVIGVPA